MKTKTTPISNRHHFAKNSAARRKRQAARWDIYDVSRDVAGNHPSRSGSVRRVGVQEFQASKLSPRHSNEARGLAGSQGASQLSCGLLRGVVARSHRAGRRRILVRRYVCLPEKCAAGFFKRILRHCVRLIHLGLLISSSFGLQSSSNPAFPCFPPGAAEGWYRGPWTKLLPIKSNGLPSLATAGRRRIYGQSAAWRKRLIYE
jgi:hypothetical protein